MAKKNQAAAPAPAAEEAQNVGTVEAVEAAAPEGVTTTEEAAAPAPEGDAVTLTPEGQADTDAAVAEAEARAAAEGRAGVYAVQWHIKTGGRRYGPGETVELTEEQAAPFLASGAIVKG